MTHFLASEEKPDGYKLEDILLALRKDILTRCLKVSDDMRPEALHVMNNNMKVLSLLSDAIVIAQDSTTILDRAFGPRRPDDPPRVGKP